VLNHYSLYIYMRNDPYTHFSQQLHNKLTWLVIFYYVFKKRKQNKTKKIIKYYQPDQLVVGLLWEMSVGIISLYIYIYIWVIFLVQLLHNFNYFFFFFFYFFFLLSTIGFVFQHVSHKYSMVDLKKKLLKLCKSYVRVVQ
jgi:hypothetical protein